MPTVHRTPRRRAANGRRPRLLLALLACTGAAPLALVPERAFGQATQTAEPVFEIDLPTQPLAQALAALSRQTGWQVFAEGGLVNGRMAPAVRGRLSPQQAVDRLLAGSGLAGVGEGKVLVVKPAAVAASEPVMPAVTAKAGADLLPGELQKPYAGGQVARGARLGVLGERDLFETPVASKTFTQEFITDQIALNSNDVMLRDASFTISNAATLNGATAGKLRGFRVEPFESSYDGFASISSRRYPLEMIERVEVLKGPTTIFTGVIGGVGGSINYVSKKPLDAPLTRLTALYSGQAQAAGQADLSRRFGPDDAFGVRVNLAWRDGETAIDDLDETNRVAHVAFNWRTEAVHLDVQLGSIYGATRGSTGGYFLSDGVAVPRVPDAARVSGPAWDTREQREEFFRTSLEATLSPRWSAFAVFGAGKNYERYVGLIPAVTSASGAAESFVFAQQGRSDWGDNFSLDAGLRGKLRTGAAAHKLTFAASHQRKKSEYSDLAIDPSYVQPPIDIYDPASYEGPAPAVVGGTYYPQSDSLVQGLTLADELAMFDDRLRLTLGLRHTRFDVTSFNYAAPTPPEDRSLYDSTDWSPSLGVLYRLTPTLSVYGNYLKAVEQGAIAPIEAENAGEVVAPGVARQYEAGFKVDLGRYAFTSSLFDIVRPSTYVDSATRVFGLYGKNRHRGIELDLFGEPRTGLRTQLSFTHLNARVLSNDNPDLIGRRPISVPDNVLVAGVDADIAGAPGLALQANLRLVSKQYYDASNARSVPGYGSVDLGARYRFQAAGKALVARARLTNVLDRSYYQSTDFTLQPGAPRTLQLSLQADF